MTETSEEHMKEETPNNGHEEDQEEGFSHEEDEPFPETIEEKIEYYKGKKELALSQSQFYLADTYQEEIVSLMAKQVEENLKEFCDSFESACDYIYDNFERKLKKFCKKCHTKEIDIRSGFSKRFQNTEVIHLARIAEFDDKVFEQYLKLLLHTEDTKYNEAIEKSRKLALCGKYKEANVVVEAAKKDHASVIEQREKELTKKYKNKVKLILENQQIDLKRLEGQLQNALNDFQTMKNKKIELFYKAVRGDLDRCHKAHADIINKQFVNYKNSLMKKSPKQIFDDFYNNYLQEKNLIPRKVEKLSTETMRKKKAMEEKKKRKEEKAEQQKLEEEAKENKNENTPEEEKTAEKETKTPEKNPKQQEQPSTPKQEVIGSPKSPNTRHVTFNFVIPPPTPLRFRGQEC